ncbi:MAG: O-antigen ligase family protein [Gemmataceae bacterium]
MKQLIYMLGMLGLGTVGAVVYGPFWSAFVYYHFALLRPQFLWEWSLPGGVAWSMYAAAPAILFALLGVGETGQRGREWGGVHLGLLAFFVWVTLSMLNALNQEIAYEWYVVNFKIFLMVFVGSVLIATQRQVWWMFLMTAASLGFVAYEFNFKYLVDGQMTIRTKGFAEYDNNGAGIILAMGVPICWFAWEGLAGKWWRWVYAALIPVILHAVLMSFSRGAMLALVVTTPLITFRSRYRGYAMAGMVLFCTFGLPLMAGKEIQERFFSVSKADTDETARTRFGTWEAAYKMAQDYPLFGVGLRNSPLMVGAYGYWVPHQTIHSQYFQVAADTGFVGLGIYLFLLGSGFVAIYRARGRCGRMPQPDQDQARSMLSGLECAMVTFMIGAVFLSLETLELTYLVLLLIARLSTLVAAATDPPERPLPV